MTNVQIILTACELNNINEPVDTFAGWKRKGFSVKRGEKAKFKTKIWKPTKSKSKTKEDVSSDTEKTVDEERNMYLVNASFFTESQVEKTKECDKHGKK